MCCMAKRFDPCCVRLEHLYKLRHITWCSDGELEWEGEART